MIGLPRFRVKLRMRVTGYVNVSATDEDAAMLLAEERANFYPCGLIYDSESVGIDVDAVECEESK